MRLAARLVVLLLGALASAILSTAAAQATVPVALIVPGQGGLFSYDTLSAATTFPANTRIVAAREDRQPMARSRSSPSRFALSVATKAEGGLPIVAGGAEVASKSQRIKQALLPNRGRIRYVPPKRWNPNDPLPQGAGGGYVDRFGNEWVRGPSRTAGDSFEWDVQLSQTGRNQLGWLSRDGTHVNVNRRGQVTHR